MSDTIKFKEMYKEKVSYLKTKVQVLYLVFSNDQVKWYQKAIILIILIYALSPIDLIPDFIPILGLLDDFILIPLGVYIVIKLVPTNIWKECEDKAKAGVIIEKKYKIAGLILVIYIWLLAALGIYFMVFKN